MRSDLWILVFAISLVAIFIILNLAVSKAKATAKWRSAYLSKQRGIGRKPIMKREIDHVDSRQQIIIAVKDFIKLENPADPEYLESVLKRFLAYLDAKEFDIVKK